MVKALLLLFSIILLSGCQQETPQDLKVLIDPKPATLHPRHSLDATSQHLNALIFRGLIKFDPKFKIVPDLAEKWEFLEGGKKIRFQIRNNLKDHRQVSITAERIAHCLENYRTGHPVSPFASSFPMWKETQADSHWITIKLSQPDPYFLNNVTLLRYFTSSESPEPCPAKVENSSLIGNGPYLYPSHYMDQNDLFLIPASSNEMPIHFFFILDDINKMLKLIRGEVDVAINVLSPSQLKWFEKRYSEKFNILDRDSIKVSYLSFNLKDPILMNKSVRKAIALAIPRKEIVQYKLRRIASVAQSLLSPLMSEKGDESEIPHDPKQSEKILDEAGFPRKGKYRFSLKYKTTPAREGIETAKLIQHYLDQVGIQIIVEVVESSTFYASLRKKSFQLFSSRWVGIKDASILYRMLHSDQLSNRAGYSNPDVDNATEQLMSEPDLEKRRLLIQKIENQTRQDFPFVPLWFWTNTVIYKKEFKGIIPEDIPLSGSLEPLLLLRK